ncbi:MAG: hypothetical protein ACKN9W_08470 [Methylococcus sp.]
MLAVCGLLAGCAGPPAVRIGVPFDANQARVRLTPGANQIVGNALMWLSSGGVISCAGEQATLYPVTPYAREWARLTYESVEHNRRVTPPNFAYRPRSAGPTGLEVDPAFLETSRSVSCDADGRFSFDRVGDGDYYLVARIAWQAHIFDEHNYFHGKSYLDYEGSVMKKVSVRDGQKATVSMQWSVPNSRFNLW